MTAKTHALPPGDPSTNDPGRVWLPERADERLLLTWACAVAVVLHGLAFMIHLPEPAEVAPPPHADGPIIRRTILRPPPPPRSTASPVLDTTRRVPIPAKDPDAPEPIEEPRPEVVDERSTDVDLELPLAERTAPPAPTGPRIMTPDITQPVLIQATKVAPVYPELPRRAGMPGGVILQAVIRRDGSVGDVTVLRSTPPGLGFEESAVEAVRQWRYQPATQDGEPVEVYFTVHVSFELR